MICWPRLMAFQVFNRPISEHQRSFYVAFGVLIELVSE